MPSRDFFERNEAKLCSPINTAPRPLSKPPVSFSLEDEVPHIFIRESHQWPRKILISGGQRLFQQHRPVAAVGGPIVSRCEIFLFEHLVGRRQQRLPRWSGRATCAGSCLQAEGP